MLRAVGTPNYSAITGTPIPYTNTYMEVAVYGDSRLAGGNSGITSYGSSLENAVSPVGWITTKTKGKVVFPADLNFAVGGDTTTLMLARLSAVAACRAKIVLILASINDRGGAAMTADQTIANFRTMLSGLSNKTVWLIAELPRGDSTYTSNRITTPQLEYHGKVREWMRDVAPKLYSNVVTFDCYDTFAQWDSVTGDAILGYHHDGLHPSTRGAEVISTPIANYINATFPDVSFLPTSNSNGYSATNNINGWLNSNPMMSGTSGSIGSGGSGTLATNWTFARNSAAAAGTIAAVLSKVSTSNGEWEQLVITGNTVSNAGPQFSIHQDITLTDITDGDEIEAFGEIEVDAGSNGILAAQISFRMENPTVYESKSLDKRDASSPYPTTATSGVHIIPKTIICPPTITVCRIRCIIDFAESITGVSATVRFRKVGVRKKMAIV